MMRSIAFSDAGSRWEEETLRYFHRNNERERSSFPRDDQNRKKRKERKEKTRRVCVPPAPSTSILIVPLGPRLVLMTSCKPFAALMFMNKAAALSMLSAFGFTERREEDILMGSFGRSLVLVL